MFTAKKSTPYKNATYCLAQSIQKPWLRPVQRFIPAPLVLPNRDALYFIPTQFQTIVKVLQDAQSTFQCVVCKVR